MDADPHQSSGLDNWDDQEDPGPGSDFGATQLSGQFSSLNVDAKPFIPNVHAPAFVPGSYATNTPDSAPTENGMIMNVCEV